MQTDPDPTRDHTVPLPANDERNPAPATAGRKTRLLCAGLLAAATLAGCGGVDPSLPTWSVEPLTNPLPPGAMSPSLQAGRQGVWISWIAPEPGDSSESPEAEPIWTVGTAQLGAGEFVDATIATRTDAMFANWADFPTTATAPSGAQYVHHLSKLGNSTYAYGVFMQGRTGAASPWIDLGLLHDDSSATEHGFVSYTLHGDAMRAFWLDGRRMLAGGPMTLRTSLLPEPAAAPGAVSSVDPTPDTGPRLGPASELLDDRVCECCQTDAATTDDGPIVVYRDRSLDEIRDIHVVRLENGVWSEPTAVHDDGWKISGCPVNGPAIVAHGDFVAVAWFTAADDEPRTRLAFSEDGGRSFSRPLDLAGGRAGGRALGRIDLVMQSGESRDDGTPAHDLWVAHLGQPSQAGETHGPAILVDHLRFDGRLRRGRQTLVAGTSEARSSGFPRMAVADGAPVIAWVDGAETRRVLTARLAAKSAESD